jgi:hypothetical protein
MACDVAWFQAFLMTPPVMFGRRLLPFSIAHHYALRELESPYVVGGKAKRADLLLACSICSRTWEQIRLFLGQQVGVRRDIFRAFWWRRFDFTIADESFSNYVDEYETVPQHSTVVGTGEGKSTRVAAPFEWHLVAFLMREYGMSESEGWNMPINRAKCFFDVEAERNGDDSLMSEYELGLDELCAKMREAAKISSAAEDEAARAVQEYIAKHKRGAAA